jgi:hypothetical protein
MLRNIHPNPDKRMTPQETKAFFVSIFYECWTAPFGSVSLRFITII